MLTLHPPPWPINFVRKKAPASNFTEFSAKRRSMEGPTRAHKAGLLKERRKTQTFKNYNKRKKN